MAHKKFGFEHILALILALACAAAGVASMSVIDASIAAAKEARAAAEELAKELEGDDLEAPSSGMIVVLNDYADANEGTAVEYLSTTAVASGTDSNEYINSEGTSTGKYIVCTAETYACVYSAEFDLSDETAEDTEEIARIYTYGLATLISQDGGWCYIISDGIAGYVKAEDFAFGEDAEALDESTYITKAVITKETANLYELANSKSTVMCILKEGAGYEIISDTGYGFLKIYVDGIGEGYVVASRTETTTERTFAVSLEDAQADEAEIAEGIAEADDLDPSFIWPLPSYYGTGRITTRFSSGHRGIDIRAPRGTSIYAVMDGTVAANYYDSSKGYVIVLYHGGGIYTLCYHMNEKSSLTVGTKVSQGQVIGYVGATGSATGYHLHFAVGIGGYDNSHLVDPSSYLGI